MPKAIALKTSKYLLDTESVLFNAREPFRYTSGNIGPVYVDCRRPLSFPEARSFMMDSAAQLLKNTVGLANMDIIAGAETAGIPYGALIADRLGLPNIYIRKTPKGHGRMSQIEGYMNPDDRPHVVLTEDLQNYGHSKQIFIDALRKAGAVVEHFFVLFDYGIRPDVRADNAAMGLTQHHLCNWWDVLEAARDGHYFDEDTLQSVESYLDNAQDWAARYAATS